MAATRQDAIVTHDADALAHLPRPLLDDFKAGRWLPIVGAGLSIGAEGCAPATMPTWEQLGASLAAELPGRYSEHDPVEAISAYEQAFGRRQLAARVMDALFVGRARPSATQLAFARLSFENVLTTNVEQLLEDAYRLVRGPVLPIVEDGQLRLTNPYDTPTLVKLHGDIHHPRTLILTEDDYDNAHLTRPLMFTWLASQLISRTGVLIGYSLGDPDVRMILAGLRRALGATPPDLWVLTMGANQIAADRYRRRGVRVVNLPESLGWGQLENIFNALADLGRTSAGSSISGTTSVVDAAITLSQPVDTFVFFLVHPDRLRLYTEFVFPSVIEAGLVPVSRADVRAERGFSVAATDALLRVAGAVVVESMSLHDPNVARARSSVGEQRTIVVGDAQHGDDHVDISWPQGSDEDTWGAYAHYLVGSLKRPGVRAREATRGSVPDLRSDTLVAVINLEAALRALDLDTSTAGGGRGQKFDSLRTLLERAIEEGFFPDLDEDEARMIVEVRNSLVHGDSRVIPDQILHAVLNASRELTEEARGFLAEDWAGDPSVGPDIMLSRFETSNGWPHRVLYEELRELGYSPYVSSSLRPYIRWVFAAPGRRRMSIYQDEAGLSVDSRVYRSAAARLPGAMTHGRRVLFRYVDNELSTLIDAARRLRDETV